MRKTLIFLAGAAVALALFIGTAAGAVTAFSPIDRPITPTQEQYGDAGAPPLPSGAATAAKQPALGTAGASSVDVLSMQGIAGGTPTTIQGQDAGYPIRTAPPGNLFAGGVGHTPGCSTLATTSTSAAITLAVCTKYRVYCTATTSMRWAPANQDGGVAVTALGFTIAGANPEWDMVFAACPQTADDAGLTNPVLNAVNAASVTGSCEFCPTVDAP